MASVAARVPVSGFHAFSTHHLKEGARRGRICIPSCDALRVGFPTARRLSIYHTKIQQTSWLVSASNSGLEASISEQKKSMPLLDFKIEVESRDDENIMIRVDLNGDETQKAFDNVLTDLARTAPPIPGFRRTKGGKTSKVPKSFLLQMLGRDRVTKFVIQEIVSTAIADYMKKENLSVDNKCNTKESAQDLEAAFEPGREFHFTAIVQLEKQSESEPASPGPL